MVVGSLVVISADVGSLGNFFMGSDGGGNRTSDIQQSRQDIDSSCSNDENSL